VVAAPSRKPSGPADEEQGPGRSGGPLPAGAALLHGGNQVKVKYEKVAWKWVLLLKLRFNRITAIGKVFYKLLFSFH
jgi:hypothetical protein